MWIIAILQLHAEMQEAIDAADFLAAFFTAENS